ncbi:MAG: M28 family peptidase [Asgard group archaeon]|nr:M28 family peptidase [Asgard group archaeon]
MSMMKNSLINKVSLEHLYEHILKIEGVKHPINAPEKLNEAADYIKCQFEKYGLKTAEQTFKLEEFDLTFRNIEGYIGNGEGAELLITSHYDTVYTSPGANDNGSGIAVMLEAARVLAEEKNITNVRFVCFTLEEFNAAYVLLLQNHAYELGLTDKENRFLSYESRKKIIKYQRYLRKWMAKGKTSEEAIKFANDSLDKSLSESERKYIELFSNLIKKENYGDWVGKNALIGSGKWVEKAIRDKKKILGVINLECVGYTSNSKYTQIFPSFLFRLLPRYKTNTRKMIGNFIAVVGDKNSRKLVKTYCKNCKHKSIQLPYISAGVPLSFETIAKRASSLLRSDHAPFWKENIPAIMVTDTAEFRYPFYHTRADTIDKLNFDFIKKVCQAVIATTIEIMKT